MPFYKIDDVLRVTRKCYRHKRHYLFSEDRVIKVQDKSYFRNTHYYVVEAYNLKPTAKNPNRRQLVVAKILTYDKRNKYWVGGFKHIRLFLHPDGQDVQYHKITKVGVRGKGKYK